MHISTFFWLPVIPTVVHPLILAIWPTQEPTDPAAVDTTTVSPETGCPTLRSPRYAVIPFIPATPNDVDIGRVLVVIFLSTTPASTKAYSCQPNKPVTRSPG